MDAALRFAGQSEDMDVDDHIKRQRQTLFKRNNLNPKYRPRGCSFFSLHFYVWIVRKRDLGQDLVHKGGATLWLCHALLQSTTTGI